LLGREAAAFVKRASGPYFLYLAFGAPHYPMMAPKRFYDRLPASMDRDRRMHAAVVEAMDEANRAGARAVGSSNTIVFFQSDNGATWE
jgi:arylsulfatase A-like enzyme